MVGVITAWDILAHPVVTIQCFGWQVFFQALFVAQDRTFLSLVASTGRAERTNSRLAALVDRCIELEMGAKRIYIAFATVFSDHSDASRFFETLARQEQEHADLLALCSAAARRSGWTAACANPWEDYIPCLEEHLREVEKCLCDIRSLEDALRLVIQIESSEVNRVFEGALASCDATFVRRLNAFRKAMENHISYIVDEIPKLDPRFIFAKRELSHLFPQKL